VPHTSTGAMGDKLAPTTRHAYTHEGRVVYEWDQTLDECNFYVRTPPGVKAKILDVEVTSTSVKFGIKGNPPYLHHERTEQVKAGDSFWTLEDGELHMQMTKLHKGRPWVSLFKGHGGLDPAAEEAEKARLMKERFAEEHPGFDFSGAEFNGAAPDPSKFMGGIGH